MMPWRYWQRDIYNKENIEGKQKGEGKFCSRLITDIAGLFYRFTFFYEELAFEKGFLRFETIY